MANYAKTDPYGQSNHFLDAGGGGAETPSPDDLGIPRGTKAWRDQWQKRQDWITSQVVSRGGSGDPEKVKKILEDLGMQNVKEKGMANFSRANEIASNAKLKEDQANARQWWAGGHGRALTPEEQASIEAVTGYDVDPATGKNVPPDILAQWAKAGGLKGAAAADSGGSVGSGGTDMWPGATGQEGSLPSYASPQYNPVDSWGGWSGVYGNTSGAPANPAGLGQAPLSQPAGAAQLGPGGVGNPSTVTAAQGGLQRPAGVGETANNPLSGYNGSGINPQVQGQAKPANGYNPNAKPLGGYNGSGINPAQTMGQSMMRPNRRRNTGVSGLGQPTTLGLGLSRV